MFDEKNKLDPLGLETEIYIDDDDDVNGENDGQSEDVAEKETQNESTDDTTDSVSDPAESQQTEDEGTTTEDQQTEEKEPEQPAEDPIDDKFLTEYPKEEFEGIISDHTKKVFSAINNLRSKEDSITRLSKEVQKYRDEYCAKNFKPIAMSLIALRESCRKSLSSLDKPIEFVKIKKFVNYLVDDIDDLLSDIGLECEESNGYVWTYNGTPLFKKSVETATFPEVFDLCESEPLVLPEPGDSLTDYIAACEDVITAALANVSKYDKCINDYVKVAAAIDAGILAANVYPVLRGLTHFAPRFKADVIDALNVLDEENAVERYGTLLAALVEKLEDLLVLGGVDVEAVYGGSYDLKKHKIIKLIPTDDESLERTVESVSTDCYSLGGLVISPAKVNVYKYQPKKD